MMEKRDRFPVVVVALAAVFFLFSGCGPSAEEIATQTAEAWTPTPTATPEPTSTPTPLPPTDTPTPLPVEAAPPLDEILENIQAAMQEVSSYHFEMTMEMSISMEGVSMEMPFSLVGDYQAPDRAQIMMTMEFLGTSLETEIITIGDTTYSTDPATGEWSEGEAALSFAPLDPGDVVGAGDYDLEDPVLIGIEEVNGVSVYHLSGSVSAADFGELLEQDITDGLMTIDYWVGVEDYLLRKIVFSIEFTGTMMEGMEGTQDISVTVEMIISDYNEDVSIEAPID